MIDFSYWTYCIVLISLLTISCDAQDQINQKVKYTEEQVDLTKKQDTFDLYDPLHINAPSAITRNIIEDRDGNIWFATFGGIIRYDGESFTNLTETEPVRFFSALEDKGGILWFGSIGSGVYRYDGTEFEVINTETGLVDDQVTNIYEDNDGKLWFGTIGGISIYANESFTNLTIEDGMLDNDINSVIQDQSGIYWIGTRGKAFTYDGHTYSEIVNDDGDPFYNVRQITMDSRGYIWMGGNDGLWRYDGETYLRISRDFTGYIYEDLVGNILTSSVSASEQGWTLNHYDHISINKNIPEAIPIKSGEGMFFGILEDSSRNIWVGNLDGVYRIDQKGNVENFKNG